jgi:hypothetical protein
MADDHFSRETIERFLRSELSRDENRDFIRHLLRQCPLCSPLLRDVARRQDFRFLIRGLEDAAFRFDPDSYDRVFEMMDRKRQDADVRAGPELEPEAAGG